MTQGIFALLYSRLGNSKKSYDFFKYSFTNNMLRPFGVMAETQFGTNPYFLTGAGGVIQAVIFGYAGIDITDQGVVKVQTVIPDQW
jgi:trehalose/maltose hydrolase-like predicted phosphorylase